MAPGSPFHAWMLSPVSSTRTGPAELGEGVGGSSGGDVDNVEGPLRCRVVT